MPEIQLTADGSQTLYIPEMDEHYHSVNGAIQESQHVYIETGFNQCIKPELNVLEFGFGTGLNAFLTALKADENNLKVNYTTIEKYPLSVNIYSQLTYSSIFQEKYTAIFRKIHQCEWEKLVQISNQFCLKKVETDFSTFNFEGIKYDIVYYDAFAPDKQPGVWTQEIFDAIYKNMNPNGILTTYCAKGSIRRMMQSAGFVVERLSGPPGKREMLRASKSEEKA